jgi:uncharacterized membrane protein YkvA (DUF1232 family)
MRLFLVAKKELPRALPLFRDPAVPTWAKVLALLAAVLVVSPLNLLSDIPLLGFFDDAVLLAFVLHAFVRFADARCAATLVPVKVARRGDARQIVPSASRQP